MGVVAKQKRLNLLIFRPNGLVYFSCCAQVLFPHVFFGSKMMQSRGIPDEKRRDASIFGFQKSV